MYKQSCTRCNVQAVVKETRILGRGKPTHAPLQKNAQTCTNCNGGNNGSCAGKLVLTMCLVCLSERDLNTCSPDVINQKGLPGVSTTANIVFRVASLSPTLDELKTWIKISKVHFLAEFQMARQKAILFTNYSFFLVDMGMIATLPHIKESMLEQELAGLQTLVNKDSIQSNRDSWKRERVHYIINVLYRSRTAHYHRRAE